MSATILDGKTLAKSIQEQLRQEIAQLQRKTGQVPQVRNIMLGDDSGASVYANSQKRAAEDMGIQYALVKLAKDIPQKELISFVQGLNRDPQVHGIMLHKPFPAAIDYRVVANEINPAKDLEGVNTANIGKMLLGETSMVPCTPAAVMELIASTGVKLRGKEVVIVGASEIVGKPLSLLLLGQMATVSVCHIATTEAGRLPEHVRRAEILVVAVGKPGVIKGEWVRPGAIVIDVGINQVNDKIVGDVEFEVAKNQAAFITPVPGGVGPVTVTMLMRNAITAFKLQGH
jgi:methylenetetrahydrofolate dehydrogenase (NADP+) / methenyltetrahydrofolate cyclohydrolase